MKTDTTFDHWDTSPVKEKASYQPESYSAEEWRIVKDVERAGDDMWTYSSWVNTLDELEIG